MQSTVRRDGKRDKRSRRSSHGISSAMFANLLRRGNMEGVEVDLPPLGQVDRATNVGARWTNVTSAIKPSYCSAPRSRIPGMWISPFSFRP